MKLLIYTHEFPPFRGGAGVYSYDLATGLAELGVDVHVAATRMQPKQGQHEDAVCCDGLHMHYMAEAQPAPATAARFLARLLLRENFDLILLTERRAQEIFASMPLPGLRYAAVIHGTEVLDYFGGRRTDLALPPQQMRAFYEHAVLCIGGSRATAAMVSTLIKADRPRVIPVHYGINLARLPPANDADVRSLRIAYGTDTEIVFCLGRLGLDKGQDALITAFREVNRRRPQTRLLLGGDGPTRQDLLKLRSELGLEQCVEFLGEIDSTHLPAYFGLCDLFVLTSRCENRWEGLGLVYLEAGYYGKAVLGGNEGGVPEAVADGESGLVVDPRNVAAIADAVLTLLGDSALRQQMGRSGRERVLTYFNSARMAKETLQHLELICKIQPPRSKHWGRVVLAWHVLCETLESTGREFLRRCRRLAGLK